MKLVTDVNELSEDMYIDTMKISIIRSGRNYALSLIQLEKNSICKSCLCEVLFYKTFLVSVFTLYYSFVIHYVLF